jgi:Mini-chromosome maintenance replisome factor
MGALQLANGTYLTFDETVMQSGTLNSKGVENVQLLKKFNGKSDGILSFYPSLLQKVKLPVCVHTPFCTKICIFTYPK